MVVRQRSSQRGLGLAVVLIGAWGLGVAHATLLPVGSEFRVNSHTSDYQIYPAVAAGGSGGFVVVWESYYQDGEHFGVFGQRYDSSGAPAGSEFQVNTYTTEDQRRAAVAVGGSGGFVVVWESDTQDGSGYGVFGQRYDSSGTPAGSEFQANSYTTGRQGYPAVAADGSDSFLVVWQSFGQDGSSDGVFGQRYDSSGAPAGSEFQVNMYTTSWQRNPAVVADSSGGFVVVWKSDGQDGSGSGVFGQRYDSAGAPAGSEFQVNTYTTFSQGDPAVTADGSGGFVVVWDGSGATDWGGGGGVFGQRYDSSGAPAGSEFQVNTYTTSTQRDPAVAADGSGGFLVAWQSFGQDGSSDGVFGQHYDSSGAPAGSEFQVNTYTTSWQRYPAVAADSSGGFVVVWDSNLQDGSWYGVYGQRYELAAPTATQTPTLTDTLTPTQIPTQTPTLTPTTIPCQTAPLAGCRTAEKSLLLLKNSATDDTKDKLIWKWIKGQATSREELADPTALTDYALCIYTGTAAVLLTEVNVPAHATRWSPIGTKGYKYDDGTGSEDGVQKVNLKGSDEKKAKILVKGKGANLPDPTLGNLAAPVTVQVVKTGTALCFEGAYGEGDIIKNEPDQFKAKAQ